MQNTRSVLEAPRKKNGEGREALDMEAGKMQNGQAARNREAF